VNMQKRKDRGGRRQMAEKIVEGAFTAEIQLKAAMLVIHRVRRTMDEAKTLKDVQRQQQAMEQLMIFADAHPLSPDMEKHL